MLYFSTEISDIKLSHAFIQLFFTTEINTAIFTWIIAVSNISNKFVYTTKSRDHRFVFKSWNHYWNIMWIIAILNFNTKISDIQPSVMIAILYFSTEINIDILIWIITILNFSTEISDTRPSRVIVLLYFSIETSTEMLTCIIIILSFNT